MVDHVLVMAGKRRGVALYIRQNSHWAHSAFGFGCARFANQVVSILLFQLNFYQVIPDKVFQFSVIILLII